MQMEWVLFFFCLVVVLGFFGIRRTLGILVRGVCYLLLLALLAYAAYHLLTNPSFLKLLDEILKNLKQMTA